LRGILEAQQRFRILNLIRIPMSIFSFAGPLLVLPFSHNLVPVIGVLVGGRLLGCVAHQVACFRTMPALRENLAAKCSLVVPLVKFGGWMSITNLLASVMYSADRFFIGAMVSLSAVAYYTAPFDMLSRITVIPQAVVGVLFPAFAVSFVQDPGRIELLLGRSLKYIFLIVLPITLIVVTFAPEGLQLWLGPTFSQNGTAVLRWLAAGVFLNSLSIVPFVLIQSAGRPDITAKLLLAELPLYLAALWLVTQQFGIQGTAIAWTGRLTVEAFLLFFYSLRLLPEKPKFLPKLGIAAVVGLAVLYTASLLHGVATKTAFLSAVLGIFGLAGWFWGLGPSERVFLVGTRAQGPIKVHGD
jgi:O-antigen/teichoic acid export membrane protein